VFRNLIKVGIDGSSFEEGFVQAATALGARNIDPSTGFPDKNVPAQNAGFIRDDASLYIVFVSDEEEGAKQDGTPVRYYQRLFEGLKAAGNDTLSGTATVLRATGTVTLAARAQRGSWRFTPTAVKPAGNVTGRWNLTYGDNKVKGLVLLKQVGSQVSGTVQLPTGDMRYLSGELNGNQLKLSTFDGSFTSLWQGTLAGDTLKGASFAATSRPTGNPWEAKKEKQATMNAVLVEAPGGERLSFRLPTPEGQMISLNDARYKGKVVVITLGGAWCPNCHDEAIFMGPYAARRQKEGLEMIGLQFEYGTDQARAMRQITSFKTRYKLPYPMVYGGQPNAEDTKKVLGDLAPVKVWPSTIFIGRDGRVKEVHVGWAGPATGALSEKVKREFDETVTKLLKQKA
jgi:peroxiredoxin